MRLGLFDLGEKDGVKMSEDVFKYMKAACTSFGGSRL